MRKQPTIVDYCYRKINGAYGTGKPDQEKETTYGLHINHYKIAV
jgi:hypothetical protein